MVVDGRPCRRGGGLDRRELWSSVAFCCPWRGNFSPRSRPDTALPRRSREIRGRQARIGVIAWRFHPVNTGRGPKVLDPGPKIYGAFESRFPFIDMRKSEQAS